MEIDKKHIVFLTPGFAVKEEDTHFVPAFLVYLKRLFELHSSKIHITVLSFQFPYSKLPYKWHGISVIPLNGRNKRIHKLWVWPKAYRVLKRIHNTTPITCIHSLWLGECAYIGERFSIKYGIKHLITIMGQESVIKNRYFKKIKPNYSNFISLSQNHYVSIKENLNLESYIIPWGLNVSNYKDIQESNIDVLGVGSLIPVKNYDLFITVISQLKEKLPNLKVKIIGFGKEQDTLEKRVNDLNLNATIEFTGLVNREVVLDAMSKSKLLLHTSTFESFGFVFLEALYSGLNIVSSNVGCAIQSKNWMLCQTESEFTNACLNLLESNDNEKERILLHSVDDTVQSYLNLYLG